MYSYHSRCKWHDKEVGGKVSVDYCTTSPRSKTAENEKINLQKFFEAKAKIIKQIKSSIQEWPTCPMGTVNLKAKGYRNERYAVGVWRCTCQNK